MPLDDTNWATSTVDTTRSFPTPHVAAVRPAISRSYHPRRRSRISPDRVLLGLVKIILAGLVVATIATVSEVVFPNAGLITRVVDGNAVANRNYVGGRILRNGQFLKFTVAGNRYEVVAPSRTLTPDEQQALLGYAAWAGYPAYSADGPFTIDP